MGTLFGLFGLFVDLGRGGQMFGGVLWDRFGLFVEVGVFEMFGGVCLRC